ncbi:MAG: hypothetical protein HFG33_05120 [Bacilli bacterium]|nr:hypothetical protein [Bacilli bacterium]
MAMTSRQFEVLEYIKKFIAVKGYSPTVREIAQGLNFKSPSSAQDHIKKLEMSGLIKIDAKKSRTIELLVQNEYLDPICEVIKVPLLSNDQSSDKKKFITVPSYMLNGFDKKDIYGFEQKDSIYVLCTSLRIKSKPSIVKKDGIILFDESGKDEIVGNIISEFKFY